jgi:hypothetical protein
MKKTVGMVRSAHIENSRANPERPCLSPRANGATMTPDIWVAAGVTDGKEIAMSDYAAEVAKRDAEQDKQARDLRNATWQEREKYNAAYAAAQKK